MSNEEIVALIQAGEREKLQDLWIQVERFIVRMAKRAANTLNGFGGVTVEDLTQCGYLALVDAVGTYKAEEGKTFIGWLSYFLKREFAKAAGYRTSKRDALSLCLSLDRPVGDEEDGATLFDLQENFDAAAQLEDVEHSEWLDQLRKTVECALSWLPEGEEKAIRGSIMQGASVQKAADSFDCSAWEIRKRRDNGLNRLRRSKFEKELRCFVDANTPYYRGTGLGSFRSRGGQPEHMVIVREERRRRYGHEEQT